MKDWIYKVLSSMILSWLCYLLCSYILIEVFVNSRPIEIGIEIVSEQNQEVTISYNVFPAQAGAVSYRRQLKKGTNFISTPFLEDLEIRRLYLLSSAPINFSIQSFNSFISSLAVVLNQNGNIEWMMDTTTNKRKVKLYLQAATIC